MFRTHLPLRIRDHTAPRSRLLSHLPSDEAPSGSGVHSALGIHLLTFSLVAVVDPVPVALRRPGYCEPLTGFGVLDRVTLMDLGRRHFLCDMFGTHSPSRIRDHSVTYGRRLRRISPPHVVAQKLDVTCDITLLDRSGTDQSLPGDQRGQRGLVQSGGAVR